MRFSEQNQDNKEKAKLWLTGKVNVNYIDDDEKDNLVGSINDFPDDPRFKNSQEYDDKANKNYYGYVSPGSVTDSDDPKRPRE